MPGSISVLITCAGNADDLARVCADIQRQARAAREIVIVVDGDIHRMQRLQRLRQEGVHLLRAGAENTISAFLLDSCHRATDYVLLVTQLCEIDREYFAQAASALDNDPAFDYACSEIDLEREPNSDSAWPSWLDVLATGEIPHPAVMFRRRAMLEGNDSPRQPLDDDLNFFVSAFGPTRKGVVLSAGLITLHDRPARATAEVKSRVARLQQLYLSHLSDPQAAELLKRKEVFLELERQRDTRLSSLTVDLRDQVISLREEIQTLTRALHERKGERVAWGDLRRPTPLSPVWGSERGTPVNRHYIERFLAANRQDIRGHVLEVKDSHYARSLGTELTRVDVLDINPANAQATIIADLTDARSVPSDSFDCFILTQVLNVVFDCRAALAHALRLLRPGGVLLCTVASVDRVSYEDRGGDGDFWRFTQASLRTLLAEVCPVECYEVGSYGNVMTCAAHLFGFSAEELAPDELETTDPGFPLIVAARVVKPTSGGCVDV